MPVPNTCVRKKVNFCRCNRTAAVQCVKAGKQCQNCLPSHVGCCTNVSNDIGLFQLNQPASGTSTITSPISALPSPAPKDTTPTSMSPSTAPTQPHITDPSSTESVRIENLPPFSPAADPIFIWGNHNSEPFLRALDETYNEIIHWRLNLFKLLQGKARKRFVMELTRLYTKPLPPDQP